MTARRLLLWDIDRTLLAAGGVGGEAFGAAFESLTGRPMQAMSDPAGRTERHILRHTLELHGLDPARYSFAAFAALEAAAYRDRIERLRATGRVLPGVPAALKALGRERHVVQTVLTGNTRAGAEAKLDAFGLDGLDLALGAYGDVSEHRPDLVPVARALAEAAYGHGFEGHGTVIIGDTVHDVAAAREHGARVIAVATGGTGADELAAAGADTVFPDLSDTAALIAQIAGP